MAASSVLPFQTTSMSSAMIWTVFKPCSSSFRTDWNKSLDTFSSNGSQRKCMFPNGVLAVVK